MDEVDVETFERVAPLTPYNQQRALTAAWYTLPYLKGTGSWQEESRRDAQGPRYDNTITALLPHDSPQVRGELDNMANRRYLLRLRKNGVTVLIGCPEQPLEFTSTYDTGAQGTDQRGHRVTFSGPTLWKAPGYIPVF